MLLASIEMRKPLEVCLRHLDEENHEQLEAVIEERAKRLDRFADRVIGCHVTVDRPQFGPTHRNAYRVLIRLTVPPNKALIIDHQPVDAHGSAAEVIADAFDAIERRLDEHADIRRGFVKAHTQRAPEFKQRARERERARAGRS